MLDTVTLPFIIQQICLKDSYHLEHAYSIEEALQKEMGSTLAVLSSDFLVLKQLLEMKRLF